MNTYQFMNTYETYTIKSFIILFLYFMNITITTWVCGNHVVYNKVKWTLKRLGV